MSTRSIGIALRATLGFSCITALSFFLGFFALQQISEVRTQALEIQDNWLQRVRALAAANTSLNRYRMGSMQHILTNSSEEMNGYEAKATLRLSQIREQMAEYSKLLRTDSEREQLQAFNQSLDAYATRHQELLQVSRAGDKTGARSHLASIRDAYDQMTKSFELLITQADQGAKAAADKSSASYADAKIGVLAVIGLVLLGTIVIAWLLTRSIIQPLNEALKCAQTVASGDLTNAISPSGNDEATRLLEALSSMQRVLLSTLRQIGGTSTQLASAAEELNAVTEEGGRETHRQHLEIEQAATAVTEMSVAIEQVARNAAFTLELTQTSQQNAVNGQRSMEETLASLGNLANEVLSSVQEVEGLADQAQGIGKVLEVIRTIAEQTNLLALNAAIEAARAGDAGRGFAVVADEVRALAHRTSQSTREIEEMIGSIQLGTEKAVKSMQLSNARSQEVLVKAEQASAALESIVENSSEISRQNLQITTATEEQARVARAVDQNILTIRNVSVQTSEGAKQVTAASQALAELAVELHSMVKKFRTD
ncbi:methyl-accepting chemotaxis protein [Pseudomonas sp. NPDC089408]|uniref:methyl-accepting chemotaxis protein n=1 Tax=unclassified Pseudomonas TaxID=196821 RepID=UPI0037FD6272